MYNYGFFENWKQNSVMYLFCFNFHISCFSLFIKIKSNNEETCFGVETFSVLYKAAKM